MDLLDLIVIKDLGLFKIEKRFFCFFGGFFPSFSRGSPVGDGKLYDEFEI